MTVPALKDNSEPRRPGRPRGGKRVTASREQLLDIALNLFSRQGIANTSLNAIAREAGVTPAMLHYYFNSREQLLDAMIEERFLPLRERIGAIFADNRDSPVDALTEMVRVLAALAGKYRWFAPLDEKYHTTLATIKGWQQEGKLNPALAPELLFTTLLSLVLVPFSRMRNDERLNALSPEIVVRHVLAVIGNGIGG